MPKHKKKFTTFLAAISVVVGFLALSACRALDPYEGMVLVPDGAGGEIWVDLHEELEVSIFKAEDFYSTGGFVDYRGEEYIALRGIDVSEHQQVIDWAAVAESGIEFAVIRAGYRGYSEGTLNEDMFFRQNIEGALENGVRVGIYFFSQAVSVEEAREEAWYLLELIKGYAITLPVFFDWETVSNVGETRTGEVTGGLMTDCALAFCEVIRSAGYEPGVYFYRSQGYREYELQRLAGLTFWAAALGDYPDFYYEHSLWQYSFTGSVPGIEYSTDLDIYFEKVSQPDTSG